MNLGAPELVIVLVGLVPFALTVWGIVDAASRPDRAWQRSGQSKSLWVVLQVIGLFVCLGWVLSIVYLTAIRPEVVQHQ